jgi:NCS1 family nucleobase:cation symporter-1
MAGAFLPSVWLELLGMAVGVLAGPHAPGIIAAAHRVIGAAAVAAIVLGAVAANAANVYSNSLSAAAVGIRAPRWALAVAASVIGFGASLASSGRFEQAYENFLLLLGYWFTAWLGVQVTDFYLLRHRPLAALAARPVHIPALAAFGIAIAAEVPFMSSTLWTGWIARSIGGADLAFYTRVHHRDSHLPHSQPRRPDPPRQALASLPAARVTPSGARAERPVTACLDAWVRKKPPGTRSYPGASLAMLTCRGGGRPGR